MNINRTVWKFPIQITDHQTIVMPEPSEILTAQFQNEKLCLWAAVNSDPNAHKQNKTILIRGTGDTVIGGLHARYISTVQQADGALIWHIFEQTSLP